MQYRIDRLADKLTPLLEDNQNLVQKNYELLNYVRSLERQKLLLIIALAKITYTLAIMVFNTSSVVPYDVAEQAVMFFLYFGFIGLIVQYFKSGYHFPLRYFIYAGITAMLRLIIVNHESSVDTILFAGAILIMVIALCLVLYSNKIKI
ncbi:MAG: phosphate-starvation-inducible protein PsiE [Haemophilus parainfluenzae]|nr:phosphate-starvation-inducible protein PsiE [Haemophilus parainfluenzae]